MLDVSSNLVETMKDISKTSFYLNVESETETDVDIQFIQEDCFGRCHNSQTDKHIIQLCLYLFEAQN